MFVFLGVRRFDRIRSDPRAPAFLGGAGPAAIGAILGSAISLASELTQPWQYAVLATALTLLLALRRSVVLTILAAGAAGTIIALAAAPLTEHGRPEMHRRCASQEPRAIVSPHQLRAELVVDPACRVGQGLLTWPGPEIAVATAAGSPRSTAAEHIPGQESPRLPDWDRGLYSGAVDEVMRTVAEAMLTTPVRHPLSATVGEIRDFFRDDHVHAALIVSPAGYLDGRNRTAESHCHQR